MLVGKAIYSILSNDGAVTTITTQIASQIEDQTENYPQLVYKLEDSPSLQTYAGPMSLQETKVSIYVMGLSDTDVENLSIAVFDCLSLAPSGTYSAGVAVDGIYYEGSQDSLEKRPSSQNQILYIREMQFRVWYQQT